MTINEKTRQIETSSGSGSTVCRDARSAVGKGPSGTFARPPPGIGYRLNDFYAKKDGFQGMGHRLQTMQLPMTHRHRGCEIHRGSTKDGARQIPKEY